MDSKDVIETISFSYTRGERIRCVLQPKNANGPSMMSILGTIGLAQLLFELLIPGQFYRELAFLNWTTYALSILILLSVAREVYKVPRRYLGEKSLSFGAGQMVLSVEGLSIQMTALRQFGLISHAWFALRRVDGTLILIPKRIFDNPSQIARFKKCGEILVANHKSLLAGEDGRIGGVTAS